MLGVKSAETGDAKFDNLYLDKWLTKIDNNLPLLTMTSIRTHL